MTTSVTLTSYVLSPWNGSYHGGTSNLIELSYADLDFSPSAADSYKSTSGDVFKVFVDGVRIYRRSDQTFASGEGFREDGDSSNGTTLNGKTGSVNGNTVSWDSTTDDVWTIDTANRLILLNKTAVAATDLYGNGTNALNVTFSGGNTKISLTRAVQDLKSPSIDFSNASILTEQDLDNSAKNVFHVAQQAIIETENALKYNSGTDAYESYLPGTTTVKRITGLATPTGATDAVTKAYSDINVTTTAGYRDDTLDHRDTAEDYATRTAGTVRHFDGATNNVSDSSPSAQAGVYSAKEHAIGTQASTGGSAKNWASQVGADVTGASSGDKSAKSWAVETGSTAPADGSSKEWAITTGSAVASSEYSAKEYAQGTTATGGSAKEWAQDTSAAVDTTFSAKEYAQGTQAGTGGSAKNWATQFNADVTGASSGDMSAKEWAVGVLGRGVANEGSSKDWATYTSGTVDNADYSAKYWALDAEQSKLAAKASASAVANVYDNFADTFLGSMADSATASSGSANGTWSASSSSITLASTSGTIEVGQEVTGSGIPADANVLSIDGSTIVISENMTNAGSSVSLTFTGQGVYGAFNGSKDGPSTDNDGDALATGALYFNTTDNAMKIYDGANWIAASASGSTSILVYKYVATGGQTTFTGNDANGASLSYTQLNLLVFLNGIRLDDSDFTATSGTSIVLGSGATASDELVIVTFKSFTTADMVPASTGGTFAGNVSMGDNNITNVGNIALDSISADATSITISSDTALASGVDLETSTTGKIKQRGAFMQSSTHQSWVLGG